MFGGKIMQHRLFISAVFICLSVTAYAKEKKQNEDRITWEKPIPCPKNGDPNGCYASHGDVADRSLQKAYRLLLESVGQNPRTKQRLEEAQRAWIAWRASELLFCTESAGYSTYGVTGRGTPMQMAFCGEMVDDARRSELMKYRKNLPNY